MKCEPKTTLHGIGRGVWIDPFRSHQKDAFTGQEEKIRSR
jgi:hypothetical protein